MALSIFLRNTQNICKLRVPSSKFIAISSVNYHRLDFSQRENKISAPVKYEIPKLGEIVRHFSTTSIKKSSEGHDHGKLWTYEKFLSLGLLGIFPLGIMYPNVLFDILMAVGAVMHMHWGFEAIVVDYVRPVIFGRLIPKIALGLVYVLSIFTLVGLFNLTFNNSGIGNGIRLLWKM